VKHNVYFEAAVQSLRFDDGSHDISVGVIVPGEYAFTAEDAEHVEILAGSAEVDLLGRTRAVAAGGTYDVPPGATFKVRCREHVTYICHFFPVDRRHGERPGLNIPPILTRTPTLVAAIIDGLPREATDWRPNQQRWSMAMVMAHLVDSEVNCFRARLSQTATDPEPVTLRRYDQWGPFTNGHPIPAIEASLEHFRRERDITLRWLRSVPGDVRARRARHEKLGDLTFGQLLNEFAFHDLGHMRQLLELARGAVYYPEIGAWQDYYTVSP
jgi:uncharacterized protein YaiE (UPF0345 family)